MDVYRDMYIYEQVLSTKFQYRKNKFEDRSEFITIGQVGKFGGGTYFKSENLRGIEFTIKF